MIVHINSEYINFYIEWFKSEGDAMAFLNKCYEQKNENLIPLRLANKLARVISFADFCMTNKKGNRSVQVFFWMAMIESFEYIIDDEQDSEKVDKLGVILNFFRNHIITEDKDLLLRNLQRSIIDDRFVESTEINLDIVARILYSIRNEFTHGLDFHTSLFSGSNDDNFLESIKMKEYKKDGKEERHFNMSITHEQLRRILIRSSINMIEKELLK